MCKYKALIICFPSVLLFLDSSPLIQFTGTGVEKRVTHDKILGKHKVGLYNCTLGGVELVGGCGVSTVELQSKCANYNYSVYYEVSIVFLTCFHLNTPNSRLILNATKMKVIMFIFKKCHCEVDVVVAR